ncbi:MAG: Amt family ammonium transporter [Kiritimatiellia bacterium]|jgi:Amt family ammonium transporter
MKHQNIRLAVLASAALLLGLPTAAMAAEGHSIEFTVGTLWILIATALVFIMHLGFASLEAGLTQAKNTTNILFKNVSVVAMGLLVYAFVGFNLMYPGAEYAGGFFGFAGFGIGTDAAGVTSAYNENYTYWADFIFQAMFAATAVTIVSGAVAERVRIQPFMIFALLYLALCYPVVGMWKWGGGFLHTLDTPFYDFAGSTLVHSVGGWAALMGIITLGPRIGKYESGQINNLQPSSMPLATVGVFLLWFGWYGFNGGSVLSADPGVISYVFVTTSLASAAGIMGAMLATVVLIKHLDLAMVLNGALAGLVGVTAGADQLGILDSVIVGFIAGVIVVVAVIVLDRRLKLDDPVGAVSVHLVCGIWGTLAVGLFGNLASPAQFLSQLIGVGAVGLFCVVFSGVVFFTMKKANWLRVSAEVEIAGLDMHEHGISGYRGERDTTPPTVFIIAPAYGSSVAAEVEILANATDDRGVSGLRFSLDGQDLGDAISVPPYSMVWDTTTVENGRHLLTAIAWDAAGNQGVSVEFKIDVAN